MTKMGIHHRELEEVLEDTRKAGCRGEELIQQTEKRVKQCRKVICDSIPCIRAVLKKTSPATDEVNGLCASAVGSPGPGQMKLGLHVSPPN